MTSDTALATVAADVERTLGKAWGGVANAGIAVGGPVLHSDATSYDRVIEVNLLSSIRTLRAFLPQVVASNGYVLQIASLAALVPAGMMGAYSASKSGAEAFAFSLRGADERPGLGTMRARLPGVLSKTYPLAPAVARIVDGITHQRARVYAQPGVRVLTYLRPMTPTLTARIPSRDVKRVEAGIVAVGPRATTPVGAGGAADSASR